MKTPSVKVPRLVVRSDTPGRRRLVIAGTLILVLLLVWGAFEWGRGNLGLPGGITPDRVTLRERVVSLEDEIRMLRVELARRESERLGQARERTELARTIGELRADVQRLQSELGLYRGVVGAGDSSDGLKVQQFKVSRMPNPGAYRLRLVLGRPLNPQGNVAGKVRISVEGTLGRNPVELGLAELADVQDGALPFDFRYLQEIEQVIRLPAGFTPVRIVVELNPTRKGVNPVRETFPWTLEN
jgi:hypothetical protein